jgi:hypothetical protein
VSAAMTANLEMGDGGPRESLRAAMLSGGVGQLDCRRSWMTQSLTSPAEFADRQIDETLNRPTLTEPLPATSPRTARGCFEPDGAGRCGRWHDASVQQARRAKQWNLGTGGIAAAESRVAPRLSDIFKRSPGLRHASSSSQSKPDRRTVAREPVMMINLHTAAFAEPHLSWRGLEWLPSRGAIRCHRGTVVQPAPLPAPVAGVRHGAVRRFRTTALRAERHSRGIGADLYARSGGRVGRPIATAHRTSQQIPAAGTIGARVR